MTSVTSKPNTHTSVSFYPSRIDLAEDIRASVVEILSQTLATTLDLKTQTKQAHWNVKGMNFYSLHLLFDEMASELEEFVDTVAERITALGGKPMGTARRAAANSLLSEYPSEIVEGDEHVNALSDRFATYGAHVRSAIEQVDDLGDADTADLYTDISRVIDKRLWFLEAHLTKKSDA